MNGFLDMAIRAGAAEGAVKVALDALRNGDTDRALFALEAVTVFLAGRPEGGLTPEAKRVASLVNKGADDA